MTYTRKKAVDQHVNDEADSAEHLDQKFRTPSWFVQEPAVQSEDSEQDRFQVERPKSQLYFETPMPEAYAAYRRRLEQRFKEGQAVYDLPNDNVPPVNLKGPQQRRPTLPLHEIQGQRRLYELEQEGYFGQESSRQTNSFPWGRMLLFGTVAVFIGTLAGLSVTNIDLIKEKYQMGFGMLQQNIASLIKPAPFTTQASLATVVPRESVVIKKTVATATLDVADVKGSLGSMIPLMLSAQNADSNEPLSLKISGLPEQAYLTAGVRSAPGSWTLKPSELSDVKLVVPQSDLKQFDMEVAAVETRTGELAAPIKAMNVQLDGTPAVVVMPATQVGAGKSNADTTQLAAIAPPAIVSPVNAAPDTAVIKLNEPSGIPSPISETTDFVAKGNALLESGDIISARQFFLRAAELGNAQGSFGVARSYDPKVFAQLNVVGLQPDPVQAAEWYQKAAQAGVVAATQ